MTNSTYYTSPKNVLAAWSNACCQAENYWSLVAAAEALDMQYEVERLTRNAKEFEVEAEHLFEMCIELGIEP